MKYEATFLGLVHATLRSAMLAVSGSEFSNAQVAWSRILCPQDLYVTVWHLRSCSSCRGWARSPEGYGVRAVCDRRSWPFVTPYPVLSLGSSALSDSSYSPSFCSFFGGLDQDD